MQVIAVRARLLPHRLVTDAHTHFPKAPHFSAQKEGHHVVSSPRPLHEKLTERHTTVRVRTVGPTVQYLFVFYVTVYYDTHVPVLQTNKQRGKERKSTAQSKDGLGMDALAFVCTSPRVAHPGETSTAAPPSYSGSFASATMDELRAWACTGRTPVPVPAIDNEPAPWWWDWWESYTTHEGPTAWAKRLIGPYVGYPSQQKPSLTAGDPDHPPVASTYGKAKEAAGSFKADAPQNGASATSTSARGDKPSLQQLLDNDAAAMTEQVATPATQYDPYDALTLDTPVGPLLAQYKLLSIRRYILGDGINTVSDLLGNFSSATEFGTYLHLVHNSALTGGRFKNAVLLFQAIDFLRLDEGSDDPSEYVPFDESSVPVAGQLQTREFCSEQESKDRALKREVAREAERRKAHEAMEAEKLAARRRREAIAEAERRYAQAATLISAAARGRGVRRAQERAVLVGFLMRLDSQSSGVE